MIIPDLLKDFDDGFTRLYQIKNGELVVVILDNEYAEISLFNSEGEGIGLFKFVEINEYRTKYKLTYMHLDLIDVKYKRKGLGREILKFFEQMSETHIYTSQNDGIIRDDNSHLTNNAPDFVSTMKKENLITGDYM